MEALQRAHALGARRKKAYQTIASKGVEAGPKVAKSKWDMDKAERAEEARKKVRL